MADKPPLDAPLLDLFRAELETHLETLNQGLLALEKSPTDSQRLEALMRAAHSIKGAAKIVGFDAAVQVAHQLEDCFVAAQRGACQFSSDSLDVLLRAVDALSRLGNTGEAVCAESDLTTGAGAQLLADLAAVRAGQPPASRTTETRPNIPAAARVAAPLATPPSGEMGGPPVAADKAGRGATASRPAAPLSPTAIFEFVNEAKEHLGGMVQDLLALEQGPGDADGERIGRLFRALHSVKGGAGFFGCRVIEELAHAMESVLEELRPTGVTPGTGVVDALLAGGDRILALLDDVERSNTAEIKDLVQRLRQYLPLDPGPGSILDSGDASAPPPAAAVPAAAAAGGSPRAADRAASVRIPVPLVDRLMTLAGELVLVRNQALRSADGGETAMRPVLQRLDSLTSQLQTAVTQTRMQPVGNLFARFPRMVRDLARQLGKQIDLEILGTEVELDKGVLELLSDPLTHLVRNCCDHGIESPTERVSRGKPPAGRVTLSARHLGGQICIDVADDGQGIDPERIKRKALRLGLRTEAELARVSDREVLRLITWPGFSTAAAVTDLSGRGVGMDVVKTNLDQLNGTLDLDSVPGRGSTFSLRVPLTLAIIPCLMVRAGEQRYAIPQKDLEELVCLHPAQAQLRIEYTLDQEIVRLREQLLPLVRLGEVLARSRPFDVEARKAVVQKYQTGSARAAGPDSPVLPERSAPTLFAVVKAGVRRFGLVVDEILKNEEVVVKPLHSLLKTLGCFSGATILGDGRVALILNLEGIAQHAGVRFGTQIEHRVSAATCRPDAATALLFRYGPQEQFAVPLAMIRRLVMIQPERIERLGPQDFITVDGIPTRLLRLERLLPVSAGSDTNPLFLLLPKHRGRPLGILATSLIDTDTLPAEIDRAAVPAEGVVGSALMRGRMTLVLDVERLAELADPGRPLGPVSGPGPLPNRVLVVDDTEFFRELVRGYLASAGYEVVTAANGVEALQMLEDGQFDLVVSDIEMPRMDGWTLAREIRQRPALAGMPLLALTTLSSDADRTRARVCGFDGHEVKLDRQRFLNTVAEMLRERVAPSRTSAARRS